LLKVKASVIQLLPIQEQRNQHEGKIKEKIYITTFFNEIIFRFKKLPVKHLKVLILAALLAVVSATPPVYPAVYTAPVYPNYDAPAPVYTAPAYKPEVNYNISKFKINQLYIVHFML
jgi:hypothetical protein